MKLWGGRFQKNTDQKVDDFNSSIAFDARMYKQDISGSVAHTKMLAKQGIIGTEDAEAIIDALLHILSDIESGKVEFLSDAEDIHMNIEKLLTDRIGLAGKRLHTARSRNDQVALDLRMYLMEEAAIIKGLISSVASSLLSIAEENTDTIMPGYTHLQKAQPVTFAHHMMAYFEMFKRDLQRLSDWKGRTNIMPLGSGALAGTTYPIDREYTAALLGFDSACLNSMDGVSDRDFVIELLSCLSMLMMHLSRFCEELVLWSSHEFSFVEMDDAFSTGSSIMPQKKNPDVAELVRGKTGRVYGSLVAMLTVMKGLPLAYNKDMQEDKEAVFDAVDTVKMCLPVFEGMISTMKINRSIMLSGAGGGFTNATDVADYLVKKGLPFRQAHEITGKMVFYATEQKKQLQELTLEEYGMFSEVFDSGVYDALRLEACVQMRKATGGPSPEAVRCSIALGREFLAKL